MGKVEKERKQKLLFRLIPTQPIIENFQKNRKNTKNCKTQLWFLFKLEQVGQDQEIEKIKIIVPINSHLTRTREFEKNSKNISKN